MRRKFLVLIVIFILCFTSSGCSGLAYSQNIDELTAKNDGKRAESSVTAAGSANAATQANAPVTMKDMEIFLKDKNEHYPLSDEFIEKYQQTGGGYIDLARQLGLTVNKEMHEPNQKWHFFDSWMYPSIEANTLSWDESAQNRVYSKLLCPELLLWIYEASGVDPAKVKAAKDVAEQGRSEKLQVSSIAKNMRACVPWEDIENNVRNYKPGPVVTVSPAKLTLTVGEEANVTATLVSDEPLGSAVWQITQGESLISLTPNGNQATVKAAAQGTAKVKVSYGENVWAECTVTVKEPKDPSLATSAKYTFTADLGTGKRTKTITSPETLLAVFETAKENDGIITTATPLTCVYGGGYGGSGENAWYLGAALKIGTQSATGSMTLELNAVVNRVVIVGYVGASSCKIQIGDSGSSDWTADADDGKTTTVTCKDMTVINKAALNEGPSVITIDFEDTDSLTIATANKVPFYITSIQFIYAVN